MNRTRALSVTRWCCGALDSRSPVSLSIHTSATRASPSPLCPSPLGSARLPVTPKVDLEVAVSHLVGSAQVDGVASLQQQRPVAETLQRPHVVGDEHDRPAAVAQVVEDVEALLLEGGVANGEHLVDHQDVRVDLHRRPRTPAGPCMPEE